MTNTDTAPSGGETITVVPAPEGDHAIDPREAARSLASWRHGRNKDTEEPQDPGASAKPAIPEEPAKELADEASAGETETTPPSETEAADREGELPSIEPPRSWTKEDKELFKALPRETQENVVDRERSREADFSKRQREATEHGNALAAERQQVEQARQQYESALPILLRNLHAGMAGEFSDIQSMADVTRMATEDFSRYARWDAQQKNIAVVQQEVEAARQRNAVEQSQQWNQFAKRQDDLFIERVPEFADKTKAAKMQDAAVSVLTKIGFTDQELAQLWNGQAAIPLRDHRMQLLILDGIKYRDAQAKAKAATAKPVPPVQRPGVARSASADTEANIENLTNRLEKTGSIKDAARLLAERRAARR